MYVLKFLRSTFAFCPLYFSSTFLFSVLQFSFIGMFLCALVVSSYRGKSAMLKEQLKAGAATELGIGLCNQKGGKMSKEGSSLLSSDQLTRNKRQT